MAGASSLRVRPRRRRRWGNRHARRAHLPTGRVGGALGVVGLLLLVAAVVPSLASGPPPTGVTYVAPYAGTTVANATTITKVGCYHDFLTLPYWNATTGYGGFATKDNASSCPGWAWNSTNSSAYIVTGITSILLPISTSSFPGPITVMTNMTVNGTSSNHTKVRWTCAPTPRNATTGIGSQQCSAYSQMRFNVTVSLIDTTTGRSSARGISLYNFQEDGNLYSQDNCFGYGCYWSNYSYAFNLGNLTNKVSGSFTSTTIPSHHYEIQVFVSSFVSVQVVGFVHSKDLAALNVGTKGNYWELDSVRVS
jgi:hypothetical protein